MHFALARRPAANPVRSVVDLTDSRLVAGIRRVACPARRIAARCTRDLVAVVVTHAREAGVLVHALGTRVAAVGAVVAWFGLAGAVRTAAVSAASHAPLDGSPQAVPAALNPLSWQTPARQVS